MGAITLLHLLTNYSCLGSQDLTRISQSEQQSRGAGESHSTRTARLSPSRLSNTKPPRNKLSKSPYRSRHQRIPLPPPNPPLSPMRDLKLSVNPLRLFLLRPQPQSLSNNVLGPTQPRALRPQLVASPLVALARTLFLPFLPSLRAVPRIPNLLALKSR